MMPPSAAPAKPSGCSFGVSSLKMRRIKLPETAAQAQGKVTGRWSDEEHQRFNEGK